MSMELFAIRNDVCEAIEAAFSFGAHYVVMNCVEDSVYEAVYEPVCLPVHSALNG